jgi:hypothetical protein
MLGLLEHMSENYDDGIICDTESQIERIWKIREGISMATAHNGFVSLRHVNTIQTIKFDVSV